MKKQKKVVSSNKEKNDQISAKAGTGDVEALQQRIDELTKERDEIFAKLQRVSADFANHEKRIPKQIADSVAYEKKAIIRSLLPSLDNFELALASAGSAKEGQNAESILEGVKLVFDHMLDALKNHGVKQIDAEADQQFDPAVHEAMMRRTEEDKEDNVVLEQFQKGYTLDGQVIRPAKVIVNKLAVEEQPQAQEAAGDEQDDSEEKQSLDEEA